MTTPAPSRRSFLRAAGTVSAATAFSSLLPSRASAEGHRDNIRMPEETGKVEDGIRWFNVQEWGVEGKGWGPNDLARFYDRLPAKAEGVVRDPVWSLSRDSSGMAARFISDAPEIRVRYTLFRDRLEMAHMPATGVSGIDLYGDDGHGGMRWISVFKPGAGATGSPLKQEGKLVDGLAPGSRTYQAYLPLYNGVDSLEFGVPVDAEFQSLAPRKDKAILFYGTSITHGACASRPGMTHPAILGRRFDLPIINLGFSGNGKMEPEVGALLAEIDPAVYVIDCLPNMTHDMITQNAEPLVKLLRDARPDTPIVLVEDRTYGFAWVRPSAAERHQLSRAAFQKAYENLTKAGVKNLHYLKGDNLLGKDGDATTDGSHPNDLGFMRQSDAFEPVLRKALGA